MRSDLERTMDPYYEGLAGGLIAFSQDLIYMFDTRSFMM